MASSSSRNNNNGIPLATLLEWYKIRDTFHKVPQNIPLALEMASSCQHPDARWLIEACDGKGVTTREDANRIFSSLGPNDARALCFAWLCSDDDEGQRDLVPLRCSAELGFAFAQALLARRTRGEERFKFAELSASQGERDGFEELGWCFFHGDGCERDWDKAKENFLCASELGHVKSMIALGELLDEFDPQRWRWWGRAAVLGDFWNFLSNFANQVKLFNSGSGSATFTFAIGQALQGRVNEEARTIFNEVWDFDSFIGPAKQAIAFYQAQIKATKEAMHAWTQVGIELKVVKDVRKLIAKLIWDSREEALYDVQEGREEEEQEEEGEEREEEEEQEEEEEEEEEEDEEDEEDEEPTRAQKRAHK